MFVTKTGSTTFVSRGRAALTREFPRKPLPHVHRVRVPPLLIFEPSISCSLSHLILHEGDLSESTSEKKKTRGMPLQESSRLTVRTTGTGAKVFPDVQLSRVNGCQATARPPRRIGSRCWRCWGHGVLATPHSGSEAAKCNFASGTRAFRAFFLTLAVGTSLPCSSLGTAACFTTQNDVAERRRRREKRLVSSASGKQSGFFSPLQRDAGACWKN